MDRKLDIPVIVSDKTLLNIKQFYQTSMEQKETILTVHTFQDSAIKIT